MLVGDVEQESRVMQCSMPPGPTGDHPWTCMANHNSTGLLAWNSSTVSGEGGAPPGCGTLWMPLHISSLSDRTSTWGSWDHWCAQAVWG